MMHSRLRLSIYHLRSVAVMTSYFLSGVPLFTCHSLESEDDQYQVPEQ